MHFCWFVIDSSKVLYKLEGKIYKIVAMGNEWENYLKNNFLWFIEKLYDDDALEGAR